MWRDVPYVPQPANGCGAASLAMLLRYWSTRGARIPAGRADPAAIQRALYSPQAKGIYASAMVSYLNQAGMQAYAFRGDWADLEHNVALGRPLVAALKPSSSGAQFHYVVVTGLDGNHAAVVLNDPARGRLLRVARRKFEKEWQAAQNWTLLAVPRPGE